ncbi:MAG TPA: lamin tail domain-containing protein [Pyrinomonadaceae bacterium]|jgi:hypothetical protein
MTKNLVLCVVFFCTLMCFSGKNTFAQVVSSGSLLIAEVQPNSAGSNASTGEYFILCNRTAQTINLQGLTASDASGGGTVTLPNYFLASGACVAFVNNATTAYTNFGCAQPVNALNYSGFALNDTGGDRLVIANSAANGGAPIDAVSYGTDTTIASPPPVPGDGISLRRSGYPGGSLVDTDTGSDFTATAANPCTIGTVMAAPSAASVTVTGRVISANGRGIRNVMVSLVDASGESRTVVTSTLGYFRFTDVPAGQTYTLSAFAKRYTFSRQSQALSIFEDTADVIFVAEN